MEYCRLPVECMKPITEFIKDQEAYIDSRHGQVVTRKANAADIARIEAEIASKGKRVTVDIRGELKLARESEITSEEVVRKPQRLEPQYSPVEFREKVAG